jgi:ketosteroid isomerase-like protein
VTIEISVKLPAKKGLMKKLSLITISIFLLLTGIASSSFAFNDFGSRIEEAVWQREVQYWEAVQNHDLEGYMAFWHPDFMGWPQLTETPVGIVGIRYIMAGLMSIAQPGTVQFELDRKEVHKLRSTVTTFYTVRYSYITWDGNEVVGNERYLHTWMRYKGDWVIINGKSGPM